MRFSNWQCLYEQTLRARLFGSEREFGGERGPSLIRVPQQRHPESCRDEQPYRHVPVASVLGTVLSVHPNSIDEVDPFLSPGALAYVVTHRHPSGHQAYKHHPKYIASLREAVVTFRPPGNLGSNVAAISFTIEGLDQGEKAELEVEFVA